MITTILWFRRDLRLADNPALSRALEGSDRLLPLYIHAPEESGAWAEGEASRWWLHHSLAALDDSLRRLGSRLIIRRGPSLATLRDLIAATGARRVLWNRRYEPASIARDTEIKRALRAESVEVASYDSALLHAPWATARGPGEPYRVFTPFWKHLQKLGLDFSLQPLPQAMPALPEGLRGIPVEDLGLLPKIPWDASLGESWRPGETGAHLRLQGFLESALAGYRDCRDFPAVLGTSRLSPHLHFGEIGPRQIVSALRSFEASGAVDAHHGPGGDGRTFAGKEAFIREIAWREFAHHLLYHFPRTPQQPLDARFEGFPWVEPDPDVLRAWQQGLTGIPLVDAGMRELWHTGWMHNRVRMVVASFLVKNLRIHWREGARWFWDTLVDADLANNTLGWQWSAGCGADAAPYFRVFNPVLQGRRFDADGVYVRRWVPELAKLPSAMLHHPWLAAPGLLLAHGVHLSVTYPLPLVDLKISRERALAAFQSIKTGLRRNEER